MYKNIYIIAVIIFFSSNVLFSKGIESLWDSKSDKSLSSQSSENENETSNKKSIFDEDSSLDQLINDNSLFEDDKKLQAPPDLGGDVEGGGSTGIGRDPALPAGDAIWGYLLLPTFYAFIRKRNTSHIDIKK